MKYDYNDYDHAVRCIKDFCKIFLNNEISSLKDFSFWKLFDDNGKPFENALPFLCSKYISLFDGDRLPVVYAIDRILYSDCNLPDFVLGRNYSGETINTFRTLFGNRYHCNEKTKQIENQEIVVEKKISPIRGDSF